MSNLVPSNIPKYADYLNEGYKLTRSFAKMSCFLSCTVVKLFIFPNNLKDTNNIHGKQFI